MGGADLLIYLMRPKSTPSDLSACGSAIPSVSTNLAEHHLTRLPAHSTRSSAAGLNLLGCQRPCCVSCPIAPRTKILSSHARQHSVEADLEIGRTGQPKAFQLGFWHKLLGFSAGLTVRAFDRATQVARLSPAQIQVARSVSEQPQLRANPKLSRPNAPLGLQFARPLTRPISDFDVDEYAKSKKRENKRETVEKIRLELIQGFQDWRRQYVEPSQDDEFYMISGETEDTLADERIVQATVRRVQPQRAICGLESGLTGVLTKEDFSDDWRDNSDFSEKLHEGDILTCRIKSIQKNRYQVFLTCRENEMRSNRYQNNRDLDPYYHEDQSSSQFEKEKARKEKELAKKHFKLRTIVHPRFQNITADEAMESMGGADLLIYLLRPKSTPSDLSACGSAIPSVNTNLAEHHLTRLPAHSTRSSAAGLNLLGCQRPCCVSCPIAPRTKILSSHARQHSVEADLEIGRTGQPKAFQLGFWHKLLGFSAGLTVRAFDRATQVARLSPAQIQVARSVSEQPQLRANPKLSRPNAPLGLQFARPLTRPISDVDEYAKSKKRENKRETVEKIRLELMQGFQDWRRQYVEPSQDDEFYMISGETEDTLADERIVQATVRRVQTQRAICGLESGLIGVLTKEDFSDDWRDNSDFSEKLHEGDILTCRIKSIQKNRYQVFLTCRENEMRSNRYQNNRDLDPYYHEDQSSSQFEKEKARKEKELAKKHFKLRTIVHPRFQNIIADEAME
ncbi:unnamed protein product [Camellia sinensis]